MEGSSRTEEERVEAVAVARSGRELREERVGEVRTATGERGKEREGERERG